MRYALVYGSLSGLIIILVIMAGLFLIPEGSGFSHSLWFGYLVMLAGMSFIFVGTKRFRDVERGGVIRFLPAFGLGLAIALVAGIIYVAVWETYLAATGYRFMDQFIAATVERHRAAGDSPTELARVTAEMENMRQAYANPLVRIGMTFMEIFPVGFVVALVSAALLRNPRLFPANVQPQAARPEAG
ncbi:MAG: DUF4199 domain-containing protein [Sphingomonadaceae bacterium]|nr:DUF4199 domain-containing protein [Sphingomonadaceae bacterium]